MRLSWGVDGCGFCVVVDDDRNPHEAISGRLTEFQAIVFIARLKRKHDRAASRQMTINRRVKSENRNKKQIQ